MFSGMSLTAILKMLPYAILLSIITYLGITFWAQKGTIIKLESDIIELRSEKLSVVQLYKAEQNACDIKIQEAVNNALYEEILKDINSTLQDATAVEPGMHTL